VCLLIALFGVVADAPLIVAANRDERLARPAVTMTVLREAGPRILGGRDELAGGTWLAVNEHGVVAGLTNQPTGGGGRDASRRSRGELPLALTACRSADEAVAKVAAALDPLAYNPCWLLVGDREHLFSVGLAGGHHPDVRELPPGLHVLENTPLGTPSAKAAQVTRKVAAQRAVRVPRSGGGPPTENAAAAAAALAAVLRDHEPAASPGGTFPDGRPRPPALSAACVHTPDYGTRSALIVTVPAAALPQLQVADGRPCEVPFRDATVLWTRSALA
jgi:uncharacterized protein with NRDE domain